MKGMNTQERIDDIKRITGLSEEVIRSVLNAERTSIINSLKRGERATLIGRCVIVPELRSRIGLADDNGNINMTNTVKLSAKVSPSLASEMAEVSEFTQSEIYDNDISESLLYDSGIKIMCDQIPSLV